MMRQKREVSVSGLWWVVALAGAGALMCPTDASSQEAAADSLLGRVIDARSRTPVSGALVTLSEISGNRRVAEKVTAADGLFAFPGLPSGTYALGVEAFGYTATADESVDYRGGVHRIDVSVLPDALDLGGLDVVVTRPAVVAERTQLISGVVLDGSSDLPLRELSVVLRNVRYEVMGRSTTDIEGHFVFAVAQPGLYRLTFSQIGYDSTTTTDVAVSPGQDLYVELRAQPTPFGLGEIRVSAPRNLPLLEANGFYRRRELGRGDFYDPNDLDEYHVIFASHLLRRLRDVTVFPGILRIRGTIGPGGMPCRPTIILDGMELRDMFLTLDQLVPKSKIRAVEVYKHVGEIPQKWRGTFTCAVIAIWTQ